MQLHRFLKRVHIEPVVLNLLGLVPRESSWIFDGFFKVPLGVAVGDDVKPVEVVPIFGDALFVRRQENGARGRADAFDLDEAQFPGNRVQAAELKAEVLGLHVLDLTASRLLVVKLRADDDNAVEDVSGRNADVCASFPQRSR
jgi:hypothetical protein